MPPFLILPNGIQRVLLTADVEIHALSGIRLETDDPKPCFKRHAERQILCFEGCGVDELEGAA